MPPTLRAARIDGDCARDFGVSRTESDENVQRDYR